MDRLPFCKPKDAPRARKPAVRVFRDGRECCDLTTKAGRDEYKRRLREMWERQGRKCGLQISPQCKARGGRLLVNEATFDHGQCRGMGGAKRTDKIWDERGNPISLAVCCYCNCLRGSQPLSNFLADIIP
jgi:hypothetical protein